MALRISFKPGIKQSQQAARYFHGSVLGLVEAMIDGLEERTYRIGSPLGPSLLLRTWCDSHLEEEELHALFDWLLALRKDVHSLNAGPPDPDQVAQVLGNWLAVRMGGADLFVELTVADPVGDLKDHPEFAIGMVRGRSVMVSTDTLLFTWLEEEIFGLSVAGHGSYLVEVAAGNERQGPWRQAS